VRDVVVGIGEGTSSHEAVRWGAREADRWGFALRLVRVVDEPEAGSGLLDWYSADVAGYFDSRAREDLDAAAAIATATVPGLRLSTAVLNARPRLALLQEAAAARLLVTGARRPGRVRTGVLGGLTLGSTSLFLASHAPCPTVVVRAGEPQGSRDVVVGVDGSPAADAALLFAADEAAARGGRLRLVRAWRSPSVEYLGYYSVRPGRSVVADGRDRDRADDAERGRHVREVAAAADTARRAHPGLSVDKIVAEPDRPADELLGQASGAALLVVGARGHGAFVTSLTGSTSHDVLHRSEHPVAVVPDSWRLSSEGVPVAAAQESVATAPQTAGST